jgi:hypothetical protein
MELLQIERGQKRRGLLIGDQQANLVRKAAQPPSVKQQDIVQWMEKSGSAWSQSKTQFGVSVAKEPITANGRLLPAPVLQYAHPKNYYAGTVGSWNMVDVRPSSRCLPQWLSLLNSGARCAAS